MTNEMLSVLSLLLPSLSFRQLRCVSDVSDLKLLLSPDVLPSKIWEVAEQICHWSNKNGATILYPSHPWYPESLAQSEKPPLFLSLLGEPCWINQKCLAVVGSRNPTSESLLWMEQELTSFIKQTGVVTVSGGARGIDQKCHSISLQCELPTIVHLPTGLDHFYPRDLLSWRSHVLDTGGCFLSRFPPWQTIYRGNFAVRNQLIVQMSDILLVVEAQRKSGSAMTARLARESSHPVAVVPGHPCEQRYLGTLDLLVDGATPIRDATDLKVAMSLIPGVTKS